MFFTTGAALQAAIDSLPLSKKGSYTPFDAAYYKAKYMQGHEGDLSPLEHFVQIGAALGNQPNPAFNPAYYEARYPDLTGKGYDAADLLIHFLRFGLDEGRVATPELSTFDGQAYLLANPDVLAYVQANITQFGGSLTNGAIAHYVKFGEKEGRAPFYEGNNTFTLTEAYVTYDTVTKTIVDGGSVTTTTPIVTLVDPIVTRETYWISTESGGAVPLQDLITLIGNRLFTSSFADIDAAMKIFNGSLGAIKDITLAGASDLVQDEANNTGVAGGNVTGAVGNLGSGTGNTGSASGTGGAGGTDGTGGAGTGGTIIYNEDGTIKQGDYTGDYTITVTLNDGTLYSTVLKLSESQLEFIKGLLFDANGNSRLEEREVEIYSYMPLLARDGATGELIKETDSALAAKWGPWKVQLDVSGEPVRVKAYDIRFVTETTENPDTVIENTTTTKVLVPIVLTPTENNGGLVNGGTGFKPTAGNDTIVAGRLELLHQAYIDAGAGYNTLEVDAKGTYAQPTALLNIQQVNLNNLPNVYTTGAQGTGAGYLNNSSYPALANVNVNTTEFIGANSFDAVTLGANTLTIKVGTGDAVSVVGGVYTAAELAAAVNTAYANAGGTGVLATVVAGKVVLDNPASTGGKDVVVAGNFVTGTTLAAGTESTLEVPAAAFNQVEVTSLFIKVDGDNPVAVAPGTYTAAQLAAAINTAAGDGIAAVSGTGVSITASAAGSTAEIRFTGDDAAALGLQTIAADGTLTVPVAASTSTLDLSRATSLEKLVITEGAGTNVAVQNGEALAINDLLVVGVRNGATLRLEGGFDADVTVHYGAGLSSTEPLKVELVVGDTSGDGDDTPALNIAHNSDALHLVSLGGGANNIAVNDLGGNLSYLKVSGNAGLVLSGDMGASFDYGTVTVDASENLGGVTMALTGSQNVTFTGSQGNDIVLLTTTNTPTGSINVAPFGVQSVTVVDTVAGSNKYVVDTGIANITVGDGANMVNARAAVNATVVAGNGDKLVHVHAVGTVLGTGNAHITSGNGSSVFQVGTSVNTVITNGNGNSTFNVGVNNLGVDDGTTTNTNATITNGDGNSTFTVTAANDVSIANGDGNGNFTIIAGNDVTINNGEGNATFTVRANTAVVNTGNGDSNIAVTGTGNNAEATVTAGNGNTDITVGSVLKATVTSGDGESAINVTANGQASVTSGNGDKTVDINAADAAQVVLGNGDNSVNTDDINVVSITVGDGENTISSVRGDTVTVVAGNGGNTVTVSADEINITTGTGNDTVVISGMGSTAIGGDANTTGLLNVHVGAGDNTIVLGRDVSVPGPDWQFGITALEGSSISGENITLYVENRSDLRAAELSGIESVVLNYDLARPVNQQPGNHSINPVLTLTDTQFLAIGAANFAVEGAIFNNYAQVKIIVTQTTSLTALGVDSLPRNIDLQLEVQDGVTLTMTAQQLHTKVAPGGVTLSSNEDNNTDFGNGKVVITGGGLNFDPFNTSDTVKTIIGGSTYYGGSLSDDFKSGTTDTWYNVTVKSLVNGYDRPADVPVEQVITLDSGTGLGTIEQGAFSSWHTNLEIIGEKDINFTGAIQLGMQKPTPVSTSMVPTNPFTIDFSALEGDVYNFTVDNFELLAQGGGIYGNADAGYNAEVHISLAADEGVQGTADAGAASNTTGFDETTATGLVSKGVTKYVVTTIDGPTAGNSQGNQATIKLSDATQDLEVLALRGNFNDTLKVLGGGYGLVYELQGGGTARAEGPADTSNVGKLVVDHDADGYDAVVNLVHSVAGDTRTIKAAGITINNADSITINAGTANATIASIAGDSLDHLVLVGDRNVSITDTFALSAYSMNGSDGLDSIDASAVEGNLSLSLSGTAVGSGFDFTASQGTTTLTLNGVTAGAHSSFTAEDAATFNIVATGNNNLSAATLENVDTISLGKPGDNTASSVTLSAAQALDVGLANIKLGHPGLDGTLNLVNLGSQAFDATTLGAGVELGTVTIAAGNVTLNAGTVLTGATVTVEAGSTLTLTADQYMALANLDGVAAGATIHITGLTQAHIDAGFDLANVSNATGTISLAESVNLAAGTDLNGFGVILAAGQTLGVATVEQANGLVVNGAADSAIKLLFGELLAGASIDVSGFNVDKLLFQDLLVVNGNTDGIFTGLLPRVEKVMYNNMVQLVDQTVTISAGAIVRGDLAYDFTADESKEIEDFVLNLQGGTQINGDIDLGVEAKTDGTLIQTYLKTVTINSTGTLANPQTGKTGNIISGKLTAGSEGEGTQNELLDVTINASQALSIEGGVDFSAVVNSDEVATLTVNGTANVTIGDLNTQDEGVDGLNVVNNGTGTLTVGINAANIDSTDALSFTGTGNIVLNVAGEVDLSNDDLSAVSAVSLAQSAVVTLTIAQASEIGATHFSTPGAATATLNLTNLDGSLFVRPDFASDITVSVVSVAPLPTVTLNAGTNLTGIASLAVHEGTTLNLTAAQFQQLNNAGIIALLANNGITADTVINITGLTAADLAGGFSLAGVEGDLIVNLQLAESVDLSAANLTGVDSITFGDGVTLTLGEIQQANGVDIVGGANSTLIFKDLGTTLFETIDASGFDVTFLKHTNTLTEGGNRNIDDIFAGLAETITKVVYNGEGWVNAVDQNVIIEAGTTVFDSLVYNKVETDVELQDFTINLMGGVELSGNLRLSTGDKFADADGDGVQDAGEKFLIREYLQTLTINSTGTTGNLLTGVAANIIDGDVTPMGINGSLNNNLLDVTINATQALTITGKLVFNSNVGNDNGGDGMTVNDVKNAVAELKVTGTADVNVGTIDTSDTDVVGLNVVNEGSGTITATINSTNVQNADALSFTATGTGDVHLIVEGNVDLSGDVLTAVSQITIADGATLTLSQVQFDILGAANVIDGGADGSAILNLNGVNAAFDAAAIDANIDVQTLTLAGSMDFAATASNLSGVDSIVVPAGGTLTLTAAQFQQLNLAGSIVGVGGSTAYTVHITGLTQADIDGGAFDTTGITAGTITLSLAEDVNLSADDVIENVDNLILADGQTLGVANYDQANGLKVNVGAASTTNTTIVYKFVTLGTSAFGTVKQIDASGYNVTTLKAYAASFVSGVSGAVNVEFSIDDLPSAVELRLTNNSDDLGDLGQTFRKVVIEAGVTTPTGLVFNDWDADDELSTLALTLEGGATLSGDLSIPTRDDKTATLNQLYFSLLTITSSGTAPNVIDGDISTAPVFAPFDTSENNLLKVVINGTQALTIQGDIVFNKENAGNATAVLNVNSSAAVTLGNVNTQDDEVIGLSVDNAGTGTLSFTVNQANIDSTDVLSFTGGNIALTVTGAVDLSNDNLAGVNSIVISDSSTLTLSQAQYDALGAANLTTDGTPTSVNLVLNAFGAAPFDATDLAAGINVQSIVMSQGDITLDPTTNLTGVDQIVVPEGSTLRLTAAQFKQLQGAGTIVGFDQDGDSTVEAFNVFITDLTQADITSGGELLDLGAITGVAVVNLALATTATTVEFGTIAGTTFTSAALGNASITMTADNQMVGFVTAASASGRTVNTAAGVDKDTTSIVFAFDDAGVAQATESGGVSQNNGGVNAANYDVGSLRALNVFVDGRNIEQVVRNLSGDIDLVVYQSPEDLPIGFRTPVNRTVIIEPSVTIEGPTAGSGDGFVAFIDLNNDREIRNLTVEMRGGTEIDGNLRLASLPDANGPTATPNPQYFNTLTIVSTGTAANRTTNSTDNVIDGDITAQPVAGTGASQTGTVENNLLNVVINGTQNLVVTGDIVFSKVGNGAVGGGDDAVATLNINNTGTTTIQQLDVSDNDLSGLTIVNNGGLLTVTGASPALTDGNTSVLGGAGANLETLTLSGTGDITFGFNPDPAVTTETGLDLGNVSTINASALSGNLNLGEVTNIDNANFSFISGTGVTTLTLTSDTLLETALTDIGWNFNFANAAVGSEFHLGSAAGSSLDFDNGVAGKAGSLTINLGNNTTLYIDENTNLTDLDLSILQSPTAPAIVLADGVTLTLTAAQASGLRIVAGTDVGNDGFSGRVQIIDLGNTAVDLSGIAANIAGTTLLEDNDVTLDAATNVGAFSVTLNSLVDSGSMDLSGQTIRFATQAQADGRTILVAGDADNSPGVNSTNVVWLFNTVTGPLDTSDYSGQIGRLWMTQALLSGANVEQLFTTLPNTIVRSEFTTLTQLDGFLSPSQPVDRIVELVAFTNLPNGMVFNDEDALEGIQNLTLNLGGQVSTGNISIDDAVAVGTDPTTVLFNELTINSYRALHQDHVLAPEAYVNDNDGINQVGEFVQPQNINTVGNIRVVGVANSGIDLLTVNLDTKDVSQSLSGPVTGLNQNAGANLVVGTITFDSAAKAGTVTAELNVAGANTTTVASLDASDADIDVMVITNSGTGALTITGASPAVGLGTSAAVSNVEELAINATGNITLGTAGDATKPGVSGADLSLIDVNGEGTVNLGVIALVDTAAPVAPAINSFFLDATGSAGDVTATIGADLAAGGVWSFENGADGTLNLTINADASFATGSTLNIQGAIITIDGNIDLSGVDLSGVQADCEVFVPAGSILTLTVEQVLAFSVDSIAITGSGMVKVVGDATDVNASDLGSMLQTLTVDLSGVTLLATDANGVLEFHNATATDDNGDPQAQIIIGSANDDVFLLSNLNDTVTGGAGNDTYLPLNGYYTYNVDAGTDTIDTLYSFTDPDPLVTEFNGADVLVVTAGATAIAENIDNFVATAATVVNGTANLSTAATGGVIDLSDATGTGTITLQGSDEADTLAGGNGNDTINGGLNGLTHDVLSGGAGADSFVFEIVQNNPTTPTVTTTGGSNAVGIDREQITFTGASTDNTTAVVVAYRINGVNTVPGAVIDISSADSTSATAVAAVVAGQLAGVFGSNATVTASTNVVTLVGANGVAIEITGITYQSTAVGPDMPVSAVIAETSTPDTMQTTTITIPPGTNAGNYVIGDILTFTFAFAEGGTSSVNYTVNATDTVTQEGVRDGVIAAINNVWGARVDTTAVGIDEIRVQAELDDADLGGFVITTSATGGVSATGASALNPTSFTTVDEILDFVSGTDKLVLSLAGNATNFDLGATLAADFGAAKAAAEASFAADNAHRYFFTAVEAGATDDGVLFFDLNGDEVVDGAILLVGTTTLTDSDIVTTVV